MMSRFLTLYILVASVGLIYYRGMLPEEWYPRDVQMVSTEVMNTEHKPPHLYIEPPLSPTTFRRPRTPSVPIIYDTVTVTQTNTVHVLEIEPRIPEVEIPSPEVVEIDPTLGRYKNHRLDWIEFFSGAEIDDWKSSILIDDEPIGRNYYAWVSSDWYLYQVSVTVHCNRSYLEIGTVQYYEPITTEQPDRRDLIIGATVVNHEFSLNATSIPFYLFVEICTNA